MTELREQLKVDLKKYNALLDQYEGKRKTMSYRAILALVGYIEELLEQAEEPQS